jgi:hypothetical protein
MFIFLGTSYFTQAVTFASRCKVLNIFLHFVMHAIYFYCRTIQFFFFKRNNYCLQSNCIVSSFTDRLGDLATTYDIDVLVHPNSGCAGSDHLRWSLFFQPQFVSGICVHIIYIYIPPTHTAINSLAIHIATHMYIYLKNSH